MYDEEIDERCVSLFRGTVTKATDESHQRAYFIDAAPLDRLAREYGFSSVEVILCFPAVHVEATRPNETKDDSDCDQRGFRWFGAVAAGVMFRATYGTLGKGLAAGVLYWLFGLVIFWLFLRRSDRRDDWRWFARHPVAGWIVLLLPVLIYAGLWSGIGLFWTNLVPSLQLFYGIGPIGEGAIALVTLLVPLVLVGFVRVKRVHAYIEAHPEARRTFEQPPIQGKEIRLATNKRASALALVFVTLTVPLYLFWQRGLPDEIRVIGSLIISVLASIVLLVLLDRLIPWVTNGRRMERAKELAVLDRLQSVGAPVAALWTSSEPTPGVRARNPTSLSATIGWHNAAVWDRVADLSPSAIAGGVLESFGWSGYSVIGIIGVLVASIAQAEAPSQIVPWPLIAVVHALALTILFRDLVTRRRTLRRAAHRPDALEMLRGIVVFGVLSARLRPQGRLGARAVGRQQKRTIARHLREAEQFAALANIPIDRVRLLFAEAQEL